VEDCWALDQDRQVKRRTGRSPLVLIVKVCLAPSTLYSSVYGLEAICSKHKTVRRQRSHVLIVRPKTCESRSKWRNTGDKTSSSWMPPWMRSSMGGTTGVRAVRG
jgi:hypothetical protein